MSGESGSERNQRTVAELLAAHGGDLNATPRRRRRRAEDAEEAPPPRQIIDRVVSESGPQRALPDEAEPTQRSSRRARRMAEEQAPPPGEVSNRLGAPPDEPVTQQLPPVQDKPRPRPAPSEPPPPSEPPAGLSTSSRLP